MTPGAPSAAPRVCVILPASYCGTPIAGLIADVAASCGAVAIVSDGSDSGESRLPHDCQGAPATVRHEDPAADATLAADLDRAKALGFTHAVTIEADSLDLATDLPRMIAAVREHPEALVIGARRLPGGGARRPGTLLRPGWDFWASVAAGQTVCDCRSPFRAYPLDAVCALALDTTPFVFEIESLVKTLWSGTPLVHVALESESGRGIASSATHASPLQPSSSGSFLRATRANLRLIIHALFLPMALRRKVYLTSYGDVPLRKRLYEIARGVILHESATPGKFGLCVGLGVTCGILPLWGIQTAVAALAAHALRLSKPLVIAASNISIPIMIPPILYLSLVVGRMLLSHTGGPPPSFDLLSPATAWLSAKEYLIGSVALAVAAGAAFGVAAYLAAKIFAAVRRP